MQKMQEDSSKSPIVNDKHHVEVVNNSPHVEDDVLEKLRQKRQMQRKQRATKNLFIRNILNALFMIVALIAMLGLVVNKDRAMLWYAVGLFAVIIKMVEVMLRMPGIKK